MTSVRDLYAEADLHADEVGGDFAGEAYRLGVATAEVHADLAAAFADRRARRATSWQRAGRGRCAQRLDAALAVVPELGAVRRRAADGVRRAGRARPGRCRSSACTATTTSAR